MTGRYLVLAGRIRQELTATELLIDRVERAMAAAGRRGPDSDLLLDSVALNLHDLYVGLERIFEQVALAVDRDMPIGADWHRELLRHMAVDVPGLRPAVLSPEAVRGLDEFLRFRHVVRNVYAFELDPGRIARLVAASRVVFGQVKADLEAFASFLEGVGLEA